MAGIEGFQNYEQKGKDRIGMKNEWETVYERLKDGGMRSNEASQTLEEIRTAINNFNNNKDSGTNGISEKEFDSEVKKLVGKLNEILTKGEVIGEDLKEAILSSLNLNKISANIQVSKKNDSFFGGMLGKVEQALKSRGGV